MKKDVGVAEVRGKVILSGEHSVVYGYPALVASIDKGVRVSVRKGSGGRDYGSGEDSLGLVEKALEISGVDGERVDVEIRSELPVGSGLGSSAAVSAGVIKAAHESLGKELTEDEWYELTVRCERMVRESESGLDPAAVIYEGLIKYIKGKVIEKLKTKKSLTLILFQSGKPKEITRDMVEIVGKRMKREPKVVEEIFNEMGRVTKRIQRGMESGSEVGELIDENGILLEKLGVVGQEVREISAELRELGCGVKVTGAGGLTDGSGMMVVYCSNLDVVEKYFNEKGLEYMKIVIGGQMR